MTVQFEHGEKKHIRLRICSCKNEDFLITSASYEMHYRGVKEPEDTGSTEIQGHILDILIQPQKTGLYKLRVTYKILDETLIAEIEVVVK